MQSKKVTFILPPIEDFYYTPLRRQPLGLLYLASVAKSKGWELDFINSHSLKKKVIPLPESFNYLKEFMNNQDPEYQFPFKQYYHFGTSYQELEILIKASNSALYAVSSLFTTYYEETDRIIGLIQTHHPDSLIVVGGGHATLNPEYYIKKQGVDFVILGEGENAFSTLLDAISNNNTKEIEKLSNIVTGKSFENKKIKPILNLDSISYPYRYLLKERDFKMFHKKGASLLFSRGCPHQCEFCSTKNIFSSSYRHRSIDNLMLEIEECYRKLGVTFFNFEDDNLLYYPDTSRELLHSLIYYQAKTGVQFDFTAMNGISIESLEDEILILMEKAGFSEINLSLVTYSEQIQKKLGRPFTTKKIENIVKKSIMLGMNIKVYFIIGLPEQERDELEETIRFLNSLAVKMVPSIYYNVFEKKPTNWKLQRGSVFFNETQKLTRRELIYFFKKALLQKPL